MRLIIPILLALFAFYAQAGEQMGDGSSRPVQFGDNGTPNGASMAPGSYERGPRQFETPRAKSYPSSMQNVDPYASSNAIPKAPGDLPKEDKNRFVNMPEAVDPNSNRPEKQMSASNPVFKNSFYLSNTREVYKAAKLSGVSPLTLINQAQDVLAENMEKLKVIWGEKFDIASLHTVSFEVDEKSRLTGRMIVFVWHSSQSFQPVLVGDFKYASEVSCLKVYSK
jgi:hypothetical protein